MFRSIVMSACLAGLGAGVVLTLVQQPTVAPIILAAETYESATHRHTNGHTHSHAHGNAGSHTHAQLYELGASRDHEHDDNAWAPENGIERTFWSLVTNVSVAIGFALMLCAVYTLLPKITPARGVLWGLAGFVVFFANPSIGLHPEIPGTMAANLFDRQLWWVFTSICSAAAVALIAWRRATLVWCAAVVLLFVPHLIGAPQPEAHGGLAPQALAYQFIWATTFVNIVFWLTLGVISALVFRRLAPPSIVA